MSMTIFAHNGVEHATSAETVSHTSPLIIGVTIAMVLALIIIARLLSKPDSEKEEE